MSTVFSFVGTWTPLIIASTALADLVVIVFALVWRHRAFHAGRRGDHALATSRFDEEWALRQIAGYLAVLPVVHGALMLIRYGMTGSVAPSSEDAVFENLITTGLVAVTLVAIALQLAELRYRRYVAGARRALDNHHTGDAPCCTSLL